MNVCPVFSSVLVLFWKACHQGHIFPKATTKSNILCMTELKTKALANFLLKSEVRMMFYPVNTDTDLHLA